MDNTFYSIPVFDIALVLTIYHPATWRVKKAMPPTTHSKIPYEPRQEFSCLPLINHLINHIPVLKTILNLKKAFDSNTETYTSSPYAG